MDAAKQIVLVASQREILIKALVSDRLDRILSTPSMLEQVAQTGLKGFSDYKDHELVEAAVQAELCITLADIGLDQAALARTTAWQESLKPGDSVYWNDPSERFAIANTKAFHDLSDEFWTSLSVDQQQELIQEAGEDWPGSSGVYQVSLVVTLSGKVESGDSMLVLKNEAGSVAECLAHELAPILP